MDDLDEFAERLEILAAGLSGQVLEDVMTELGVEAKKDFRLAAQLDLGPDAKFSGWLRAGELKVGFEHVAPGVIEMRPRPQGVAVVAQDGRRAGRKTRTRGKRRSASWGSTRGHRTVTDAITLTEEETTVRALDIIERKIREILP